MTGQNNLVLIDRVRFRVNSEQHNTDSEPNLDDNLLLWLSCCLRQGITVMKTSRLRGFYDDPDRMIWIQQVMLLRLWDKAFHDNYLIN